MPQRSREAYLWDIADSCRAILEFGQGRSLSDYEQNRMLRRAVERELSIVGEAVSQATLMWTPASFGLSSRTKFLNYSKSPMRS